MLSAFWETVREFIQAFGWAKGVFTIFFFLAHWYIYWQNKHRLIDRQKEIDRLAEDNRLYREQFLKQLNEKK